MNKLSIVKEFAQNQLKNDKTGHDFNHILRVVKNAQLILAVESANSELVLVSAYLHDVFDDKLIEDPASKRQEVRQKLTELGYPSNFIDQVFEIIDNMSFSANLAQKKTLSIEGQIVQDADRLDAIGAVGIARAFYYGGHFGETMYDPEILPRQQMDKTAYRQPGTVINHFYEKLLKLKDQMNTITAQTIAKQRQRFMLDFLEKFKSEWGQ